MGTTTGLRTEHSPQETPASPRKGSKGNGATAPHRVIDDTALEGGPNIANNRVPFPDLEAALGLDDDGVAVTELLINVACRKPKPTEYFRVHPDPAMARPAYVFIDREEIGGETYFVMPEARPYIVEHLRPVLLVACVNRQHISFLWPINLPDPGVNNGRQNRWGTSALEAMKAAKTHWVKMTAGSGAYRVFTAENTDLPEPQWPDRSFLDLLGVAFRETIIADQAHPIVKRLRGQV
jgi:hypothetical protein